MATSAAMTTYLSNELLDHILGTGAYTPPATVYVALFTAAPSDAGGGTEVTGGDYAREAVTFGAAASGAVANTGAVTFGPATANWGIVTHMALFDAASAGNMLFWGALDASRTVNSGDSAEFAIGDLDVTLAADDPDALSNYAENKILDFVLRNQAFSSPSCYLALHEANPAEDATGTEVSGGDYARKAIAFAAASGESATQSGAITFTTATADWGTVTHMAIWDAVSAGNMLLYWDCTDQAVDNGDTYSVADATITVGLD